MIPVQPWAKEVIEAYASHASNQFVLHGNTQDRMVLPPNGSASRLGSLEEYILHVLIPRFDVVLSFDLGNGIIPLRECKPPIFPVPDNGNLRQPRVAIEAMTKWFRSLVAYRSIKPHEPGKKVAFILKGANMVIPNPPPVMMGAAGYELSAMATLIREWTIDSGILSQDIAVFLIADNLSELHPLIVNNNRTKKIQIPFPTKDELGELLTIKTPECQDALADYKDDLPRLAAKLTGIKAGTVEGMLQLKHYRHERLNDEVLVTLKRELIERDANGLIKFMQPERTLADFTQNPAIRDYLLADVQLWENQDYDAMPMGYGIFAPVGCGKGYLVECMAGSYRVPFLTIGQFRDKYLGVAEANVERIFRFIDAAAPCVVFIDEMDQSMGKRNVEGDSGVGGRIYSMFAQKMSDPRNRGKIIWVGATSRPDQVEVDLKRPGRLDVKIPILPAASQSDAYTLFKSVLRRCKAKGNAVEIPSDWEARLTAIMPTMLTAGAANALASTVTRIILTRGLPVGEAVVAAMEGYQSPISPETMAFQIRLAIGEASDLAFVPTYYRERYVPKARPAQYTEMLARATQK
jgi:hypothetical protein